jgi:hypothetical protein
MAKRIEMGFPGSVSISDWLHIDLLSTREMDAGLQQDINPTGH